MAASSELAFFEEHERFEALVSELGALDNALPKDAARAKALVKEGADILDKYQEQSHLLDKHMEAMAKPLMNRARDDLRAIRAAHLKKASEAASGFALQLLDAPVMHHCLSLAYLLCKTRGWKRVITFFPHEAADLEPCVAALLSLDSEGTTHWKSRYVLLLWLSVLVLAPFPVHTIDSGDLGPAAAALAAAAEGALSTVPTFGTGDPWGGGIVGTILCVCQGCLGSAGPVRDAAAACVGRLLTRPDLETSVLSEFIVWGVKVIEATCLSHARADPGLAERLADTGADSPHASGAGGAPADQPIADWDTSPVDAGGVSTPTWTGAAVCAAADPAAAARPPAGGLDVFVVTGVLAAIVRAFKHGQRESLVIAAGEAFNRISQVAASEQGQLLRSSASLRRLLVKLSQRTGLVYLPPRVASWRYQRGQRSLLDNLRGAGPATGLSGHTREADEPEADDDFDIEPVVEDVIDGLLTGLRDHDTIVRWSAAKGIGRVAGRLPKEFADEVVEAVATLLDRAEGDGAWHGGCLALAELARRGLLLPGRLSDVVPRVVSALEFDERRGATSVGSHVRDAACYVCWAFARAYSPGVMRPWVRPLAAALLCVALFDREVNCRRAAAAAFQESVGRQGADNFPHGIAILTAADYFSLGNRAHAFTHVARQVAAFATYREALLEHLVQVKLRHWDVDVRQLSARALAFLTPLQPEWAASDLLPRLTAETTSADLLVRHGATLGIAEVLLSLARLPNFKALVPYAVMHNIRAVVPRAEKVRVYRGRGGLLVREAMCRLIEVFALSQLPLGRKGALRLLKTVDECLGHAHESVQLAAAAAFAALARTALSRPEADLRQRLCLRYADLVNSGENAAIRRGAALALGRLPKALFAATVATEAAAAPAASAAPRIRPVAGRGGLPRRRAAAKPALVLSPATKSGQATLEAVVTALCEATRPEPVVSRRDAETRRNAVQALTSLAEELGVRTAPPASEQGASVDSAARADDAFAGVCPEQLQQLWQAVCDSTGDYATDTRGDVGSWVRIAAADCVARLTRLLAVVPARLSLGLGTRGAPPFVGPQAGADGRIADARLVRAGLVEPGDAVVHSRLGDGVLVSLNPAGAVAVVDFSRSSGAGSWYCPYGKASVAVADLEFVNLPAADAWERPGAPGFPHMLRGGRASGGGLPSAAKRVAVVDALEADMTAHGLRPPARVEAASLLGSERAAQAVGCLLRLTVEKQDRVRSAAGRAVSRLLWDSAIPQLAIPAPFLSRLRDIVPPSVNACDEALPSSLPRIVEAFERAQGMRAARIHDEDPSGEDDEDESTSQRTPAQGRSSLTVRSIVSSEANFAAPDVVFPRMVPLLSIPDPVYARELAEGLSLAVGGLSESVVKCSTATLAAWARAAGEPKGDRNGLETLLWNLLLLLRGRIVKVPASGGAEQASAAATPAKASPRDPVSSSSASLASQATGFRVESRIVVPALRTLHVLLAQGRAGEGSAKDGQWAREAIPLIRYRVMRSKDPVRVMSASDVLLAMVGLRQPIGAAALRTVLDFLAHPFPKVRRITGERLFSTLMVFDDLFKADPQPAKAEAAGASAGAGAAAAVPTSGRPASWIQALREADPSEEEVIGFFGCDPDGATAVLSSTAWDGDEADAVAARDLLYEMLGVTTPAARVGTLRADGERWGYPSQDSSAAAAEGTDSYLALVREVGY